MYYAIVTFGSYEGTKRSFYRSLESALKDSNKISANTKRIYGYHTLADAKNADISDRPNWLTAL